MTLARHLTKKTRITFGVALISSAALLAAIFIPAGAVSNSSDRADLADGQTKIEKNASVHDGYVEFGSNTTTPQTSPTTAQPATNPQSTPTGKFVIVGKTIVDPEGNIFLPMGANIAVRQAPNLENGYAFNWRGTANGHSADVQAWGWNTIRLNVICIGASDGPTQAQTLNGIDEVVREYTAKKMVVVIDCHHGDVTGKSPSFSSSIVQQTMSFYDNLTTKYKSNPYVWFNPLNEPFGTKDAAGWTALQAGVYNRIRTNAPNNVVIADLPDWGNQIDALVDGNLGSFSSGKCNVLYGWRGYGFINGYATDESMKTYIEKLAAKNIPMIVGEFGDPLTLNEGTAGPPIQNRIGAYAVMKYGPQNGYGLLWWHATGDSGNWLTYSLTKDRTAPWVKDSSNLSDGGRTFWDVSHQPRPKVRFTGNLSQSGCAL